MEEGFPLFGILCWRHEAEDVIPVPIQD
jgi:hypothetical protein